MLKKIFNKKTALIARVILVCFSFTLSLSATTFDAPDQFLCNFTKAKSTFSVHEFSDSHHCRKKRGPTGPTGPTGPRGLIGRTGPTGPAEGVASASRYSESTDAIANNASYPFDIPIVNDNNITPVIVLGNEVLQVSLAGRYVVSIALGVQFFPGLQTVIKYGPNATLTGQKVCATTLSNIPLIPFIFEIDLNANDVIGLYNVSGNQIILQADPVGRSTSIEIHRISDIPAI